MMINNIKEFKNKLYSLITLKDKKDINKVLIIGFIVGLFELIGLALILIMISLCLLIVIRRLLKRSMCSLTAVSSMGGALIGDWLVRECGGPRRVS